ncbi:hypothetical protein L3556_09615 [Candidatus Synechococcus calcipolaris G9]|uniref:Uncharacterized protein n=1 Tax=Candidatus Synechococcus calcipolaris G9 TaxID=1497997 RepID=A0ABT6F077_9SYNE|nr:hypothetical protein [Candidatus Synechococcus calcipolaris]MDG2991183.1 hypothetical protein [Candidatus Synechococcus calcipolaris G9]
MSDHVFESLNPESVFRAISPSQDFPIHQQWQTIFTSKLVQPSDFI